MRSIKTKIIISTISIVTTALLILGTSSIISNYLSDLDEIELSMMTVAQITSELIESKVTIYKNACSEAGNTAELSDISIPILTKQDIINQKIKDYGLLDGDIIGIDGISIFNGKNYSEDKYFIKSLNGENVFTEPFITGSDTLNLAVFSPLWKDGIANSEIVGAVMFHIPENTLIDAIRNVRVSENGYAYAIDKDGYTIVDLEPKLILEGENIEILALTDEGCEPLSVVHKAAHSNESGFASYKYLGAPEYMAYYTIENTDNWSVVTCAPRSDFMIKTVNSIYITIIVIIASVLIATLISVVLGNKIGNPINTCAKRLDLLSKGNLNESIPQINSKDETGVLGNATEQLILSFRGIINDLNTHLSEMANGNFDIRTMENQKFYKGDFEDILLSVKTINHKLNETLEGINECVNQVSAASDQVSHGAECLSSNSSEQATSIEKLTLTVANISDKIEETSNGCEQANRAVIKAAEYVDTASKDIVKLQDAMKKINDTSDRIKTIAKTIEDIAMQTNILALNASVEAARAGTYGKGFSVVADEVRSLAAKSAEAAKDTTSLIQQSIEAAREGDTITTATVSNIKNIAETAQDVSKFVSEINEASTEQATDVKNISTGFETVSEVVQSNSATAEENAASSEELSSQAEVLKHLLQQFKLRKRI